MYKNNNNSQSKDLEKHYIYQSDIDKGTLILDKPGHYIVMEDLAFNPNKAGTQVFGVDAQFLGLEDGDRLDAYNSGRPLPSQLSALGGPYDSSAYGVGFFAALSFTKDASGSVLDLNGFRIEQSKEHALQQRFYANIETAGAPFIRGQGPHDFGPEGNNAATNLLIKNGTIGRSSHHGIHGNGNKDIIIKKVAFEDYEVAAVALNGVDGFKARNVTAISRSDVPVVGAWSNARFISAYVDFLANLEKAGTPVSPIIVNGESLNANAIQHELRRSINSTFNDIITEGDGEISEIDENYYLYNNSSGIVDGNSYGILLGPVGVQVNGFPDPGIDGFQTPSRNARLNNVHVLRQAAYVTEVPVLSNNPSGGSQPVIDPVGAAFMLRNKPNGFFNTLESEEGTLLPGNASTDDILNSNYKGNVLANAQLLVAKNSGAFERSHLDVSRLSIGTDIIDWVESDNPLSDYRSSLDLEDGWIYNVDNMVHVNKGVIGFKLDGVYGAKLKNISAQNIVNTGLPGFDGKYETGFIKDTLTGYNGGDAYGFTFSASDEIKAKNVIVSEVISFNGESFGFASPLANTQDITLKNTMVEDLFASGRLSDGVNPAGGTFDFFNI